MHQLLHHLRSGRKSQDIFLLPAHIRIGYHDLSHSDNRRDLLPAPVDLFIYRNYALFYSSEICSYHETRENRVISQTT